MGKDKTSSRSTRSSRALRRLEFRALAHQKIAILVHRTVAKSLRALNRDLARPTSLLNGRSNFWSNRRRTRASSSVSRANWRARKLQRPLRRSVLRSRNSVLLKTKKQYELNRDVAEKIDEALEATDSEKRTSKLREGKDKLLERNKHLLLAQNTGGTRCPVTPQSLLLLTPTMKSVSVRRLRKANSSVTRKKGLLPRNPSQKRVFPDIFRKEE